MAKPETGIAYPAHGGTFTLDEIDALALKNHNIREDAKRSEAEEHAKKKSARPHSPIDRPVEDEAPAAAAPAPAKDKAS